jgi:glutamate synthase domain-containing protein 3
MTNGTAFVYDPGNAFTSHVNADSVELRRVDGAEAEEVRTLIQRHVDATGSAHARAILDHWNEAASAFWRVIPTAALEIQAAAEDAVQTVESAKGAAD